MNWSAQESHDWRNWTKKPENVQSSTGFDPVLPSAIVKRTSKPHSRARQIFVFCLIFDEKYDHKCNKINHMLICGWYQVTNVSTQVICDWRNFNRIKLLRLLTVYRKDHSKHFNAACMYPRRNRGNISSILTFFI